MKVTAFLSERPATALVLLLTVFIGLAAASALTYRPEVDEGMFASPAMNLAAEGHFGTTVLDTRGTSLTRIGERTYWVMPLFLLNAAAFFEVLGPGLFQMRLVSLMWGVVLLLAWYFIVLRLTGRRDAALLCAGLLAVSYMVIVTASLARMDLMSASLGSAGLAVYLNLRERNLTAAVLLSQTLVMLAGLTHSNAILAFAGLAFLTLYFDMRRLRPVHLLLALVPYLAGGTAFGLWIMQDPEAFRDQFADNARMSGRLSGFTDPLRGFFREFTERYPHAFGLQANTGGHSGPIYLKSLILVGYAAGVGGVLLTRKLRRSRGGFALLVLTGIYFLGLSLLDGQKQTYYLIHIIPLYVACLAVWAAHLWEHAAGPAVRTFIAGALLVFVALQVGGIGLRIKQNTYGRLYEPTIDYLRANAGPDDLIMGKSDLGFGLGFPSNFVDDGQFGYHTGVRPKFIVYDSQVENSFQDSKVFFPEFYEYFPRLLEEEYEPAYENEGYIIYRRRK